MSKGKIKPSCLKDFNANKIIRAEAQRAKMYKTDGSKRKDDNTSTTKSLHKLIV